jgi:hypothetical protein
MSKISIPIVRGRTSIEVETDKITDDNCRTIWYYGLKHLLARGYSKQGKSKRAHLKLAQANLEKLYTGRVKIIK